MLRDYLKLELSDSLVTTCQKRLRNRGQEEVTEWRVVSAAGQDKGSVRLCDKLGTRRSWPVSYRITQTDSHGKVIVDCLTDTL